MPNIGKSEHFITKPFIEYGGAMRKMFILLTLLTLLLTACVDQEKVQLQKDLEACQTFNLYLVCLQNQTESECARALCVRYPEAVVCGSN